MLLHRQSIDKYMSNNRFNSNIVEHNDEYLTANPTPRSRDLDDKDHDEMCVYI